MPRSSETVCAVPSAAISHCPGATIRLSVGNLCATTEPRAAGLSEAKTAKIVFATTLEGYVGSNAAIGNVQPLTARSRPGTLKQLRVTAQTDPLP